MIALTACCQADKEFTYPPKFNAGFYLNGILYTTISGGSTDWSQITNKPLTYPPSAHNHDLLYKPFNYVPTWAEITGKPATFPPSPHTQDWSTITGKPVEIELIDELALLPYTPLVQKTTTEINALIIPSGTVAMVWDKTLGVLKIWNGTVWKSIITGN
jgi:hypothetical protein